MDRCLDCKKKLKSTEEYLCDQCFRKQSEAPWGECSTCGKPLEAYKDGADADGHRWRMLTRCVNPDCEEEGNSIPCGEE